MQCLWFPNIALVWVKNCVMNVNTISQLLQVLQAAVKIFRITKQLIVSKFVDARIKIPVFFVAIKSPNSLSLWLIKVCKLPRMNFHTPYEIDH